MVLAKRHQSITSSDEAVEIVTRVFTHPHGTPVYECNECGGEFLTLGDSAECCRSHPDH